MNHPLSSQLKPEYIELEGQWKFEHEKEKIPQKNIW